MVVYDTKKIVKRLRQRDDMSKEDAEEFFAYNIASTYMGTKSPIFVRSILSIKYFNPRKDDFYRSRITAILMNSHCDIFLYI